jgi:D-glycero-D-manno-heptose 1,7-bisphosphate phosphatase
MRRAAFLDRDGVINQKAPEGDYVLRWEDMRILPGVASAIALLNQAGFCVIVVTNQRCIAKRLITTEELEALHRRMSEVLARDGATIDAIYYCPHEEIPPCRCRKPQPGMLLDAARDYDIDLSASWMIGDSDADIRAGRTAGCKTIRLGHGSAGSEPLVTAPCLLEAIRRILQLEQRVADTMPRSHPFAKVED